MDKIEKKQNVKNHLIRIAAILVISCMVGLLAEFCFNAKLIFMDNAQKGDHQLDLASAQLKGAEYQNDRIVITEPDAEISFDLDRTYAENLSIEFFSQNRTFKANIEMTAYSTFDKPIEKNVDFSYTNQTNRGNPSVRKDISKITITVPDEIADSIGNVLIKNNAVFNILRFLFFGGVAFIVLSLVIYRRLFAKKPEFAFLTISIILGTIMICGTPINILTWDEEIHFERTLNQSGFSSKVAYSQSESDIINIVAPITNSYLDRLDAIYYLNSNQEKIVLEEDRPSLELYSIGYIAPSIGYNLSKGMGVPFYYSYLAGKLGNLILYSILVFFAIKIMPKGKMLLFVIALMPTPLFQATCYTYDTTVTAFMMLGFAIIFSELLQPQKLLKLNTFILFNLCMIIGSLPKAVYIPMVLLGLCLPASKFKSRRIMWIYKGIVIGVFLALMSTFVLPALINPPEIGDTRGGDTSTASQLSSILTHLSSYFKLLGDSIFETFFTYISSASLSSLAYLGYSTSSSFSVIFLIIVAITDTFSYSNISLSTISVKIKGMFGFVCLITMCLIWTAMYLSFTPVGIEQINGVQARYYIPILVPIYLLVNISSFKNNIIKTKYTLAVIGGSLFILVQTLYDVFLKGYCY